MSHPGDAPAGAQDVLASLEKLLPSLIDGLRLIAARRLGDADAAADAVQETLARLVGNARAGRIGSEAELRPIAYGILRHVIGDALRKRGRDQLIDGELPDPGPAVLDALVREEDAATLRGALARLDDDDRQLLERTVIEGEQIARMAAESGQPADRLRQRKSRALRRLAELFRAQSASRLARPDDLDV